MGLFCFRSQSDSDVEDEDGLLKETERRPSCNGRLTLNLLVVIMSLLSGM